MSNNLKGILANLFNLQLLDLQKITWESPCDLVEKISTYEAVHPLRDWKDLKHRLGTDRRCFAFMHKALPHEPIVILHAALTNQPSSSIQVSYIKWTYCAMELLYSNSVLKLMCPK